MSEAEDVEILERALILHHVCVTLDHDFHTHLAIAGQGRPWVILLRVEGISAERQASLIASICDRCGEAIERGAAVSADGESVRIRRLPLK